MTIAFVPARCGSKSIPLKNIKDFCGRPLIFWILDALEKADSIDHIYVSTDCEKIKGVVESFNLSKVRIYVREKSSATDTAPTEAAIFDFLRTKHTLFSEDDIFVLAQATSPLTKTTDFEKAIRKYEEGSFDSLLSCVRSKRFFWSEDGKPLNYSYQNRPRRQDFVGTFMENGAFYVSSVKNIIKNKNRLSGKIGIYEMEDYTAIELDEEQDWRVVEQLMYHHVLTDENYKDIALFFSDVDGTLTDAGMYYDEQGNEFKKFNTYDGKAFELLRQANIKTGIITGENSRAVERRAQKLKADFLFQGLSGEEKLNAVEKVCVQENITLQNVAYIGDDINCKALLEKVGAAACPQNAHPTIKNITRMICMSRNGGDGAVREFAELILSKSSH